MNDIELLRLIVEMAGDTGLVAILIYLLIQERHEHRDARADHVADLRRWVDREHSHHDNLHD